MRITIQKTIDVGEVPIEINEAYRNAINRVRDTLSLLQSAQELAGEGKYVDSSSCAEKARLSLTLLDKNIEEAQSLCLSYERLRIEEQMPTPREVPDDE
ncbi:MAG: hypothetical protein GOVbin703_153 [Prokaryotic dsDNA virus sp.]|nr:MAG: hypothetical protein GOVbin703_153 [Prokaryotic dsDNA virus sp.]